MCWNRPLQFMLFLPLHFFREGACGGGTPTAPLEKARGRACLQSPCPAHSRSCQAVEWNGAKPFPQHPSTLGKSNARLFLLWQVIYHAYLLSCQGRAKYQPCSWTFINISWNPDPTVDCKLAHSEGEFTAIQQWTMQASALCSWSLQLSGVKK